MSFSQTGIILKKIPYSDADEIITVLLHHDGVHRFFVPGSRKSKKRFQGLVDHFSHLNFFYNKPSKGLWRLQNVERVGLVEESLKSLDAYAFASFLAELICEFSPEAVSDPKLFELWLEMAGEVDSTKKCLSTVHRPLSTYSHYLIRLFEYTGYALELSRCVSCGSHNLAEKIHFDPLRGGILCFNCGPATSAKKVDLFSKELFLQTLSNDTRNNEWYVFIKLLVQFSENIMQKKSKAGGFFLQTVLTS